MQILALLRIISILVGIIGFTFSIPLAVALFYSETQVISSFLIPMIASILFMLAVNIPLRKKKIHLNMRMTFVIVASCWVFASLLGAIPLYFSGAIPNFVDALFESVSGFTTTGATILSEVETLPRSINLWRCQTHWLGGMGIVTLTVALLPLLGVGGFQLIKAETTGPEKGKVTARITTTAKVLWLIYLFFTILQTVLLMCFGMDFVDALSHAFATLGTGGFSTMNSSIGSYNSVAIEVICTIFMFLSGINFSLFYYAIIRQFTDIRKNSELKAYLGIVIFLLISVTLCIIPVYKNFGTALRYSSFQIIALLTTTGFGTADYTLWPQTAQFLLFLTFFIGGCSGSTGGGIKVIRWVILFKQSNNEVEKMLHPQGIFTVRLNDNVGHKSVVFNVASFMIVYFVLIMITTFVGCAGNLDLFSSFTGALSMVGNVGPAFGQLGPTCNYGFLPDFVKLWYCFAMLAGRLEIYTMIIFFLPAFWKK